MVWRGSTNLTQGKVHFDDTPTKSVLTTDYTGPYAMCLAKKPALGASIVGFPAGYKVTGRKITELDAGAGRIDVTLETTLADSDFSTDAIGEPTYEIDWTEIQKPIEMHRHCGTLNPNRVYYKDGVPLTVDNPAAAGGKQRTWEDWSSFAESTEEDPGGDYLAESVDGEAAWSLEQYLDKKNSGQDSFLVFQPVLKRTTVHLSRPAGIGAYSGRLQDPPAGVNFSRVTDFRWLGGPDSCVKSAGRYSRSTEWLGAAYWDLQTYGDG